MTEKKNRRERIGDGRRPIENSHFRRSSRAPRRFRRCAEERGGAAAVGEASVRVAKDRVCVLTRCAAVRVAAAACVRLQLTVTGRGC